MTTVSQVSIYDAPRLGLDRLFEGDMEGVFRAFIDPNSLSPQRRDGIINGLRERAGGTAIGGAVADIVTNPWVWFMFATSSVGASAIGRMGAGGLTTVAKAFSPWVRKHGGWLQQVGLSVPMEALRGTPAGSVLNQVTTAMKRLSEEEGAVLAKPFDAVRKKLGVRTLDFTDPRLSPEKAEQVKRAMFTLFLKMERLDETIKLKRPVGVDKAKKTVIYKEYDRPAWTQVDLDAELKRLGGQELFDLAGAMRKALDERAVRVYGKDDVWEKTGKFAADPEKIGRIYRGLNNKLFGRSGVTAGDEVIGKVDDGADVIRAVLGDDFVEAVRQGDLSEDAFKELLGEVAENNMQPHYFPRNLRQRLGPDGDIILPEQVFESRAAAGISPSKSAIARLRPTGEYHVDDLKYIYRNFVGTEALRKATGKAIKKTRAAQAKGEVVLQDVINPQKALHLHFQDTARTWAWFVQTPNAEVIEGQRQAFKQLGKDAKVFNPGIAQFHEEPVTDLTKTAKRAPLNKAFDEIKSDEAPLGGFSLADALWQSFAFTQDPYVRHGISHLLVPASTGRHSVRRLATQQAILSAKHSMNWLADGPIGNIIKGTGKHGEEFVAKMKRLADPNLGMQDANGGVRWLAKYLYVTHLGLNIGSTVINAMQPWLSAAIYLGPKAVASAYGPALKEVFDYVGARAKQGFKVLTPEEKADLIKKTFKYADFQGEDLLNIAPSAFETIEGVTFAGTRAFEKPGFVDQVFEGSLKLFEKAEWLNRSVVAHATENLYRAKGVSINNPLFKRDVREIVAQTQFGASYMTTPFAFQTDDPKLTRLGGLGPNPLVRQFFTFPIRTLQTVFGAGPKLGARENRLHSTISDLARGMGMSAILYSVARNALDVDVERGLFASSVTDLFGGRRFFEGEGPLPPPPIIDIPANIIRALGNGDEQLFRYNLSRLLPAGVAISNLSGSLPDLGLGWFNPQRTFVDYEDRDEEGRVPVFGIDGRMIDRVKPIDLAFKALGVRPGRFADESAQRTFLLRNEEEMNEMKRAAVAALFNNNSREFQKIQRQFEEKFGFKMPLSRRSLKAYAESRAVPRVDRLLDSMQTEAREAYAASLGRAPTASVPQ